MLGAGGARKPGMQLTCSGGCISCRLDLTYRWNGAHDSKPELVHWGWVLESQGCN
jgi:hypothetical protein